MYYFDHFKMSFDHYLASSVLKISFNLADSFNTIYLSCLSNFYGVLFILVSCSVTWIYLVWDPINILSLGWHYSSIAETFNLISLQMRLKIISLLKDSSCTKLDFECTWHITAFPASSFLWFSLYFLFSIFIHKSCCA